MKRTFFNHHLMNSRRLIVMSSIAASLLFVGAGCGKGEIAIPAGEANKETALQSAQNLRFGAGAADQGDTSATAKAEAGGEARATTPRPTSFPGVLPAAEIHGKQVRLVTTKGVIVFEILDAEGPKAASNFVALANSGFYDGLTFHRVVPGFVIQGGDPKGDGTGGPGYTIPDEPARIPYDAGIVAMAKTPAPDSAGSQFFIMLEDNPSLPNDYAIFGRVTTGLDVVRSIAVGDRMTTVTVEDKK